MNKYTVTFTKYYTYEIEADDEDEAIELAFEEYFYPEMRYSIGDCFYDDVEVE